MLCSQGIIRKNTEPMIISRRTERKTPEIVFECLRGLSAMVNSAGIPFSQLLSTADFISILVQSLQILPPISRCHALELAAASCLHLSVEGYNLMLNGIEVKEFSNRYL